MSGPFLKIDLDQFHAVSSQVGMFSDSGRVYVQDGPSVTIFAGLAFGYVLYRTLIIT